ncbi:DNA topoisomerase (ATP-hydrolyzing) subunit B [Candidatus Uhrbacteria bacterium]|nr:DNA topoisomerase (ATP-hydrolyzing) subunit B [Candidatus Uhrbacteria bacterium]
MPKQRSDYTANSITVLEGLEPVRKRPGMYIGSTGPEGLHHLIWEVVDNSIDEAMAGFCKNISITLNGDGSVAVEDDGRGIPVDINKQYKKSGLELALTKLHAGGKFDHNTYKVSGGLHGVGVSVVNALSTELTAQVHRDGSTWQQEYERGVAKSKLKRLGNTKKTGTTITFTPDPTIFTETTFSWETILSHLRQQAYLTHGIALKLEDRRDPKHTLRYGFLFEGGVASYVRHLNLHKVVQQPTPFYVSKQAPEAHVEVALQYTDEYKEHILAFANNIYNPEGGSHVVGFRTALTRSLNSYARGKGYLKEKDENLTGDDVREGLTAVISVKLSNPQFEGQTKSKLGNPEVRTAVETVFGEALAMFLEEQPKAAEAIIEKCLLTSRARLAAKAARETVLRKGVLDGLTLPGKLADCSSKDPAQSELYIVEGDSAGGCFSGDTKIALADGRSVDFRQLIAEDKQGMKNFCYTVRNDGTIGIEEIRNPRVTKKQAEVIKIILDTGEEITCTPDHRFMTRDGSYIVAKNLTPYDSLMPLRRQKSRLGKRITIKDYELLFDPQEHRWVFTHMRADEWNIQHDVYAIQDGEHRHHKDFDKSNNNPTNLVRLSKEAHLQWHRDHVSKTLHREDVKEKSRLVKQTPEFKKMMRERMKRKNAYNTTYFKKTIAQLKVVFDKHRDLDVSAYNTIRKTTNDKTLLRFDTFVKRYFNGNTHAAQTAVANYNHKIARVQKIQQRMDVYDFEVPNTHNFALASGIFVHNSAKQGRNRYFQAVLPLRGKILNVERARIDKILANNEIKNLIIAMGTNFGEQFDITQLRYHRIIIMTDADVDGAHIRTLLLTLFWRHFAKIITDGYLYIAHPPLYRLARGKEIRYAYSEEEKLKLLQELQTAIKQKAQPPQEKTIESGGSEEGATTTVGGITIQRYKGLGEMNPEQLWTTTMDPEHRMMRSVTVEDAEKADEMFDILMGAEVAPRKHFIQVHAKTVKNLDI